MTRKKEVDRWAEKINDLYVQLTSAKDRRQSGFRRHRDGNRPDDPAMTRTAWRKMYLAEQGPVSRFVQRMRGFELVPWVPGSGVLAVLFVCGPEKPGGGHEHFQVSPFQDSAGPRWGG